MNATTKITLAFALSTLAALTSCGGGGGGGGNVAPGPATPVFTLTDATVAPAQSTAELELDLDLQGAAPVLMQFDIEVGSEDLALEGSEAIRALQARGVDFAPLDEGRRTFRVIFGDAGRTDAIDDGGVVRLQFAVDQDRETGTFVIKVKNIVVADADGNAVARDALAAAEVIGQITLE